MSASPRVSSSDVEAAGWPMEVWQNVLSGRWSLIDTFDSADRRYLVLRERSSDSLPRLSGRHCAALILRAHGHALKFIAFELGLSQSTVCSYLRQAMALIGIRCDVELTQLFGLRPPSSRGDEPPVESAPRKRAMRK